MSWQAYGIVPLPTHPRTVIMRLWQIAAIGTLIPCFAFARPVVGELFTSEGCSSCPPADARVVDLVRTRPDLLLLTFHVTYWNRLGWHDPFSLEAATDRQRHYVALGASPQTYTPAMVIDGRLDAIGSDVPAVDQALRVAAQSQQTDAELAVRQNADGLTIDVSAGTGRATVLLIGYDRMHRTEVARGENGGQTLTEANVVRSITPVGSWSGAALQLHAPVPAGEKVAVLLQQSDGRIVGATSMPLGAGPR